ncbi:MAG: TrmH family RNA methyltransferase [Actinomycetota bacterium]
MITSARNRRVASATSLKKRGLREQHRQFLLEGAQATAEGLRAGAVEIVFHVKASAGRVQEVVDAARKAGVEVLEVTDSVMAHLTSAVTPQGLVAIARFVDVPASELPSEGGVIPILCSVRDPGNAGTILRSADAAGAGAVAFTKDSVDVYNPKTVRASAGSLFHLPVVRNADAADLVKGLQDRGMQVLAADARGELTMFEADLTRPTALLLGNEAWGLRDETRNLADASLRIPIQGGAESLNLAAAAALLLFEAARQRRGREDDLATLIGASVHDLRLPLTAIKGFASTLVDRWGDFEERARRELVSGMLLDLDRIASMVTLLVDTARLERGSLPPPGERQRVAATLEGIAQVFGRSPDYPELIPKGDAEARIEPSRLQAIVLALCEGAMWWGQSGPIEIEARTEGDRAVIEVTRGGGGPENAESVFSAAEGSGGRITLHMAKRVVEALGGTLTAEGGKATRFRLSLPS